MTLLDVVKEMQTLSPETRRVLWAAMCSMVQEVHTPQDNMTPDQWQRATVIFSALDQLENASQILRDAILTR